jgi:DNA ligase-1
MKKNQISLDSFLLGKTPNKKNDNKTKAVQKREKQENQQSQEKSIQKTQKSQKRENPPKDDFLNLFQKIAKEQVKSSQKNKKEDSFLFREIVDVLLKVENCKGENSKDAVKELLSNLFVNIITNYSYDVPNVYYFLSSKVGPEYISPEFGIGEGILEKIVGKVIGISDKQIKERLIETGDLGTVASEGKKNVKTMDAFSNFIKVGPQKKLTIKQIMNVYKNVAIKKGKSSQDEKIKLLSDLMFKADKDEIKFLVRSLQKSLKIGASFKTILSSFSRAITKILKNKTDEKEIYRILLASKNQLSDEDIFFGHIIELIEKKASSNFADLIDLCHIRCGIPVNPQLARPTTGIKVIFERFADTPFTCEYKYDGFRGQIHYNNNKTQIFSRNLEDMTETYPDIVEFINNFIKESAEKNNKQLNSFILDCEMVAYDKKNDKILPFQQLTTRSRKNVDLASITIHVCMFCFDILLLNDEILINKTLRERRKYLYETFTESQYIQFAKHLDSGDEQEMEAFMNESISAGCEGLIVKAIDKNSEYMPGQRNFNWLKLKKDYLDTSLGDSIDLVIIGGSYGKGKRKGLYGSFLLACYNDDNETYETVTMTGGGLKDSELEELYNKLKEIILPQTPSNYKLGKAEPEVIFEAKIVVEVKTADLSMSPIYTAGYDLTPDHRGVSLRFPRFQRTRDDKKPFEACTSEEIVKLYNSQVSINKNNNKSFVANDLDDLY